MKELSTIEFEKFIESNDKPSVIMVKTTRCPNCKALAPIFEKTGKEIAEKADFNYLVVDDKRELARSLKIMGVPTMLFYRHGVLIAKKVGNQSPSSIKKVIDSLVDLTPEEANDKEYRSFFSKLFGKKQNTHNL